MDASDAGFFYVADGFELAILAIQFYRAFVGAIRINAADDLDQRRFARAVLTHERMHVAALYIERNFRQRLYARENFCYILQLQNIIDHKAHLHFRASAPRAENG